MCNKTIINELNAGDLLQLNGMDIPTIVFKGEKVKASIKLFEWDSNNNILTLKIRSYSEFRRRYYNQIQFPDIQILKDAINGKTEKEQERWFSSQNRQGDKNIVYEEPYNPDDNTINWSEYRLFDHDIKVYCSCPSYQYYRSFQLTQFDAAIYPETRPPVRNDPTLQRVMICHHLYATLQFAVWMEPYIKNFINSHEKEPLELDKRHLKRKKGPTKKNTPSATINNAGDNNMLDGVNNSGTTSGEPSGFSM